MNRRILLIDADAEFRDTLSRQLGRYRVAVTTEPDPDRALALAASDEPALVLIGIEERDKTTGFRTFQKCKKALASTPVVLVTSTVSPDELAKHRKLKSHADEYIDKRTMTNEELIGKLDNLIGLGDLQENGDALDIPVEDDIPMELADGDVVLDETVGEDGEPGEAAREFVHEALTVGPKSGVKVDRVVEAETDAAFDALLGGDEPAPARPVAAAVPEPVAAETSAVPEPVPHPSRPDSALYAPVVAEQSELDSAAVPEPVPHPGRLDSDNYPPADAAVDSHTVVEDEGVSSETAVSIPEEDLVPLDDEMPVEVAPLDEPAPAPAPAPAPVIDAKPAPVPEAKHPSGSHPAIDLGLDAVAQDADREQSGVYDRRGLRKIGELERQITQLKQELDRARAAAETAVKSSGREAQFLKLREQVDTKDRELRQAKGDLAARDGELADTRKKLEQLQHAKAQLETKNGELERKIFEGGDLAKEAEARLSAATGELATLQAEVAAKAKALDDAEAGHRAALAKLREELETAHESSRKETIEELRRVSAQERESSTGELARQHQAQLAELTSKHDATIAELTKKHDAATAELAKKHSKELVRLKADLAGELSQLNEELGGEIAQLKRALEAKEAELAEAHTAKAEGLAAAQAGHAEQVAQLSAKHQAEIASLQEEHAEARERDAAAQAQALSQLKQELDQTTASNEGKLAAARRELEELIAQHEDHKGQLHEQHRGAITQLEQAHQQQLAEAQAERARLAEAAQAAAESHRTALAEAQRRHEAELADTRATAEREAAELRAQAAAARRATDEAVARHENERDALQEQHGKELAELEAKHERALALANGDFLKQKSVADAEHAREVAALKAEAQRQAEELEREKAELQRGLSSARDSLKRSENELASAVQTIADRNAELRQHTAAIAERDQRIAELRKEIEALEQENASYQDQVLRAYQKIKSDEAMVAKARKAMAIALTVLDEEDKAPA